MLPDERDMLIRTSERVAAQMLQHKNCNIPNRVRDLEQKKDRIEGMVALILFLVACGRVWDIYEFIRQYIFHIG